MKTKNGHILTFSEKMQISAILCFATCDWFCPMTSHIYLWDNATVDDIIHKLDGLYGSVTNGCVLLKRFFNAQQQETESVTDRGWYNMPIILYSFF